MAPVAAKAKQNDYILPRLDDRYVQATQVIRVRSSRGRRAQLTPVASERVMHPEETKLALAVISLAVLDASPEGVFKAWGRHHPQRLTWDTIQAQFDALCFFCDDSGDLEWWCRFTDLDPQAIRNAFRSRYERFLAEYPQFLALGRGTT